MLGDPQIQVGPEERDSAVADLVNLSELKALDHGTPLTIVETVVNAINQARRSSS